MQDQRTSFRHGTITGYFGRGCRCASCRGAASAYGRERRELKARENYSLFWSDPNYRPVLDGLLRAPREGVLASKIVISDRQSLSGCVDGHVSGARLRRLRQSGLARSDGGPPALWRPTHRLIADQVRRAAEVVDRAATTASFWLPPPPASGSAARFESLSFHGALRLMEAFAGTPWFIHYGPGIYLTDTPYAVYADRRSIANDETIELEMRSGTIVAFSRRQHRGATYDRTMQELTLRLSTGESAVIEFAVDD